jgi:hypothetical protein
MRLNLEQNKECLIVFSRFKFSLVINGLTDILKIIDNTVWRDFFSKIYFYCLFRDLEVMIKKNNIYESYSIVLDAVEQRLVNVNKF